MEGFSFSAGIRQLGCFASPWSQDLIHRRLVSRIWRRVDCLRPIYIVTSGALSRWALESVLLELQGARDVLQAPLQPRMLYWEAMDSGLSQSEIAEWHSKLLKHGMSLRAEPSQEGIATVSGMYAARKAAAERIRSLPDNAIVCLLDADLEMTALSPNERGELALVSPWPWLHEVWAYAARFPDLDVFVGDVTGDPPLPASSTLLSNLRDLILPKSCADKVLSGPERWLIRDAAYDLSTLNGRSEEMLFSLLPDSGGYQPLQHGVLQALLWGGALARPLVTNGFTMVSPHRPWYIRGGLTILLNKSLAESPVPHFLCQGQSCRRGDSFWMLKMTSESKAGHFPYPLLHRRAPFVGNTDELINSFVERGIADLIGASAIKAAGQRIVVETNSLRPCDIHRQLEKRQSRQELVLRQSQQLLRDHRNALPAEIFEAVSQACSDLLSKIRALPHKDCAAEMYAQINHYLRTEDKAS